MQDWCNRVRKCCVWKVKHKKKNFTITGYSSKHRIAKNIELEGHPVETVALPKHIKQAVDTGRSYRPVRRSSGAGPRKLNTRGKRQVWCRLSDSASYKSILRSFISLFSLPKLRSSGEGGDGFPDSPSGAGEVVVGGKGVCSDFNGHDFSLHAACLRRYRTGAAGCSSRVSREVSSKIKQMSQYLCQTEQYSHYLSFVSH